MNKFYLIAFILLAIWLFSFSKYEQLERTQSDQPYCSKLCCITFTRRPIYAPMTNGGFKVVKPTGNKCRADSDDCLCEDVN